MLTAARLVLPFFKQCLFAIGVLLLPLAASAEVYKWVDANGRVHFSDKKHATAQARRLEAEREQDDPADNRITFYPEADAMLSQNRNSPQGKTRVLSAGNWSVGGVGAQNTSVLRFDLSELLTALNGSPGKTLASAELRLYANTDDKVYGQGVNNKEPAGHSRLKGDNAFYLKPSHNSWTEDKVVWSDYYSNSHYLPSAIRNLPSLAVEGSTAANQDYSIDVRQLMQQLVSINLREITLELRLQRLPTMAQVTFHSREAASELRPRLVVQLLDEPSP